MHRYGNSYDQVHEREIRKMFADGNAVEYIARVYELTIEQIQAILDGGSMEEVVGKR